MSYPYVARNILLEPQTYMYAPFGGQSLLDDYHASRVSILDGGNPRKPEDADSGLFRLAHPQLRAWIAKRGEPRLAAWQSRAQMDYGSPVDRLGGQQLQADADALRLFEPTAVVETSRLLRAMICSQLAGRNDELWRGWSDRLVQRFEVAKRLYATYLPGFRKGEGDFESLARYLLFALSLCIHHATTGSLVTLNALLKVGDLMCSVGGDKLGQEVERANLRLVFATELAMIHDLAAKKGVAIAA